MPNFYLKSSCIQKRVCSLVLGSLIGFAAITLLVSLTAGDEQRGLLETQLTLPVSRISLLLQKLAAAIVIIALASLGGLAAIVVGVNLLGEPLHFFHILQYILNCVTLALVYGLVGFTIAALTGRRGLAIGVASGFAFVSYLLNSMAPSVSYLEAIDKATFFHYYQNDPFSLGNYGVLIGTAIVLIAISCVGFSRRDIRSN